MRARAAAIWVMIGAAGCGTEPPPPPPPPNPVPAIQSLTPDSAIAEGDTVVVSVLGSGFMPASAVLVEAAARPTAFVNAGELRLTVTRTDLATPRAFDIRVRNAAPGGGTSAPSRFRVVYPLPVITGVEPLEVDAPNGRDVAITGTSFSTLSTVLIDGEAADATVFSSTTKLIARVPDRLAHVVGPRVVRVVNPPPGGGTSAPDTLQVVYGAPEITTLTPTKLWRGRPVRMVVSGKRIRPATVMVWNGRPMPLVQPGYTGAFVDFTGDDLGPPGIATAVLETPGPFGGVSQPFAVTVYGDPPKHLSVSPSVVAATSAPVTITIRGVNMIQPAQVDVRGDLCPFRLINSSTLEVDLAAGVLAGPEAVQIFVRYPIFVSPSDNDAELLSVRVLSAGDPVRDAGTVNLTATDLAADPVGGTIYATVAANVFSFSNRLVAINPMSRDILWTLPIRPGAGRLAISDDGTYLYVASSREPVVDRIHLPTRQVDHTLAIRTAGGDWIATDLLSVAGEPRSVVVGYAEGVMIFDDGRRRPSTSTGMLGPRWLARSGLSDLIYGIQGGSGVTQMARLRIRATGIAAERIDPVPNATGGPWLEFAAGRLFDGAGIVIDPVGWTGVASLGVSGALRADAAGGRVHYVQGEQLSSYDATTLAKLGDITVPGSGGSTRVVRWGVDGLAIGGGDAFFITIVRAATVRP